MPCKIFLRHGQKAQQMATCQTKDVVVYGPEWVREGLSILGNHLDNVEFQVYESPPTLKRRRTGSAGPTGQPTILESFKITKDFHGGNLVYLQRIARNEPKNTSGVVNMANYRPDVKNPKVIQSIKDLARQTIIVGKDNTTHCGGYKTTRVPQKEPVYICDLAALQFTKPANSGRLVLIQEEDSHPGILDDFIFKKVTGEKKKSFAEVNYSTDNIMVDRYLKKTDGFGKPCYLDSFAYKKFVALDVVLSGTALADMAAKNGHKINFKFLQYGTGKFAGNFVRELTSLILDVVIDGITTLFEGGNENVLQTIKHLEFPFYQSQPRHNKRLEELKSRFGVEYRFSRDDALKQTCKGRGLITATSNCANSNAAIGNALGASTDGVMCKNLNTQGNIFCPNMNKLMEYKYIKI